MTKRVLLLVNLAEKQPLRPPCALLSCGPAAGLTSLLLTSPWTLSAHEHLHRHARAIVWK